MEKTQETSKLIYKSKNSVVYLTDNNVDLSTQVIKTFTNRNPSQRQLYFLKNEYNILKDLDIPGVRKVIEQKSIEGNLALVLEYVEGETLNNFSRRGPLKAEQFLQIAINISQSLGEIHQHQIIHKDININNILIHPKTLKTTIIDFGIASQIDTKVHQLSNPDTLEGTLAYISPEQTGRVNRVIDHRTDLYSLGVVFYRILTGKLPFKQRNSMELVHAHMAVKPAPPHEVNRQVPEIFSAIIMRLLEKNAEDRYQTAFGLKYDLEMCHQQLQASKSLQLFPLGAQDFSSKFRIVEKLYGREQEAQQLLTVFDRVAEGQKEVVLVGGYSGVGKSALIYEIHKPITQKNGFFIKGKYDQFNRDLPYSGLNEAFESFCDYLLTLDEDQLLVWRDLILKAVGNNGKVLTDVLPKLELIIGKQPEVPKAGIQETLNRFNITVQSFVQAIATEDHPLVLFLDDLQWVDLASLNLLKLLINSQDTHYMLLIAAYRDNEVDELHPFVQAMGEIETAGIALSRISLQNLKKKDVHQIISDSLSSQTEDIQEITNLVYEKTLGNAFFTHQLLKAINEEKLITYDFIGQQWQWDIEKIQAKHISDNVVDLMRDKISKLSQKTTEALKTVACIGNVFELNMLVVVFEKSASEILEDLWEAVTAGMIFPLDEHYKLYKNVVQAEKQNNDYPPTYFKFIHDRVQQAAYHLLESSRLEQIHLKLGRLLYQKYSEDVSLSLEGELFEVTNHLNTGKALMTDQKEVLQLAELNLRAAQKAKNSAAYDSALKYLQNGLECLPNQAWQQAYTMTLTYYNELVDVNFLLHDFEAMDNCYALIMQHAVSVLDKINAYETKIKSYTGRQKVVEATALAVTILKELHIKVPKNPGLLHIVKEVGLIKVLQGRKPTERFIDLPEMTDPAQQAALRIIMIVSGSAYLSSPNLLAVMICKGVQLSIKYGNIPLSSFMYGMYGMILCGAMGQFKAGYAFGDLSLKLDQKYDQQVLKVVTTPVYYFFIHHWKMYAADSIQPLLEAREKAYEIGNFEYVAWNGIFQTVNMLFTNQNLDVTEKETRLCIDLFTKIEQRQANRATTPYVQLMINLREGKQDQHRLIGEAFNADVDTAVMEKDNNYTGLFGVHHVSLIACILFEKYEEGIIHAEKAHSFLGAVMSSPQVPPFTMYYSLVMLQLWGQVTPQVRKKFKKQLNKNLKNLKNWAKHAPMNYTHRYYLVEAERHRVAGKAEKARQYYKQAIEMAKLQKFTQDTALIYQLYAMFWLKNNDLLEAKMYMQEACYYYTMWGAHAKVKQLYEKYPLLLESNNTKSDQKSAIEQTYSDQTTSIHSLSSTSGGRVLDLESILKASQTLSKEVKINQLAEKMLHIVIENTGATKGVIIDNDDKGFLVRVEGDVNATQMYEPPPFLAEYEHLPATVINFVVRSRQPLVLNDAFLDERFSKDTYIQANRPKSVLCYPVERNGELSILFYLENNLTNGVFTKNRLDTLNTLSSQIAISIENAILYENLENKVEKRTDELNKALKEVKVFNNQLMDSIRYAKRIQEAILVSSKELAQVFEENFVLYLPKNVVSGDFYWMSKVTKTWESNKQVFVAVVDCTGHGVPGAFMSMIGNTLLNEIVNEQKVTEPEAILYLLNSSIRNELKQNETENKDGMDICLCRVTFYEKDTEIVFSGAKRPLFYTTRQTENIHTVKGERLSIGGNMNGSHQSFRQHSITLPKNSVLYLTSDGYVDAANKRRKNFTQKRLISLLQEISVKPLEEQKQVLYEVLQKYQEGTQQRDDITILGVKV